MGAVWSRLVGLSRAGLLVKVPFGAAVALLVWYFAFNRRVSLLRALMTRAYGLTPYTNLVRTLACEYATMRDGVRLASTVFLPIDLESCRAVVVMRTPYNRHFVAMYANRFAERGYAVVAQDTRGRFESEGEFSTLVHEKDDGVDTLRWIRKQSWFAPDGKVAMWGISYLGYVQWAALHGVREAHAAAPGGVDASLPPLAALAPIMTSSNMHSVCYPDGTASMDLLLRWLHLTHYIGGPGLTGKRIAHLTWRHKLFLLLKYPRKQNGDMVRASGKMAYGAMQKAMLNVEELVVPVVTDPSAEYWTSRDHHATAHLAPASYFGGGWYDLLLRETLRDYERVVEERRRRGDETPVLLTIGPWTHFESLDAGPTGRLLRDSLALFDHVLKGKGAPDAKPVNLFVMDGHPSKGEWREFDEWPPHCRETRLFMSESQALQWKCPPQTSVPPTTYTYDPLAPTPMIAGATFHSDKTRAGAVDNVEHEARGDVLVFTSAALEKEVEVIGHVRAEVYVAVAGASSADFVVRLCDVHPDGRSINLCDGVSRRCIGGKVEEGSGAVAATEEEEEGTEGRAVGGGQVDVAATVVASRGGTTVMHVAIDMWLTANRFRPGHRIRVQVSSGQHPRWVRNLGTATGEPDETATSQATACSRISLYHDRDYPSCIILPVIGPGLSSHGSEAALIPRSASQILLANIAGAASGTKAGQA